MLNVKATTIILFAHLAVLTSELNSTSTRQIPSEACLNVSKLYGNDLRHHRHVFIYGKRRTVEVQWGSGDTNRATAALLAATLKYGLNYEDVVLVKGKETLCDLASSLKQLVNDDDAFDRVVIHVGAKTTENDRNCSALRECTQWSRICGMAGARLHVMGPAMAPVNAQFHANLSSGAQKNPNCTKITWTPYSDEKDLRDCDFMPNRETDRDTFLNYSFYRYYVDDNEYKNPECVLEGHDLSPNCVPIVLDLGLNHSHYKEFTKTLAERIRKDNLKFQLITPSNNVHCCHAQYSYLFLSNQRHYPTPAFRVADGDILRQWAPKIFDAIRLFNPEPEHIIEILQYNLTTGDLEEAACKHLYSQGRSDRSRWPKGQRKGQESTLYAVLLLCKGDSNNAFYSKTIPRIVGEHLKVLGMMISEINCSSATDFNQEVFRKTRDMMWTRIIGMVGHGAGAALAADAAANMETQVVLYDVPPDAAKLTVSARTATGRVRPLALAISHFLKENEWRRIAIISDRSQLAEDFNNALSEDPTLYPRKRFLDGNNLKTAEEILLSIRDESAPGRIFFVNTDMKAAGELLCAALNLKMTETEGYVWIVRAWGDPACDMKEMRFFTVTYWWRGGNESALPPEASELSGLRKKINEKLPNKSVWPPLTAPLVDALLLLFYETKAGLDANPDLRNDLHGRGATRKISESFAKKGVVAGIVQNLKQRDYSLEKPLVFVYDWHGGDCNLAAVWRVEDDTVKVHCKLYEVYPDKSAAPSDGSLHCITVTTGDPYEPACYDTAIFSTLSLVVLMLFMCYVRYRYRLKILKQRDHMMQMRLLARSERTAEALGPYLVSRSALEIREELGMGNFGRVHFGMLKFPKRTIAVAVKSLREEASLAEESQFLREACLLSRLSHVNIVRLVGVCAADGPPLVMMEHAFFCDLRRYLTARRHYSEVKDYNEYEQIDTEASSISPRELTRLAREAASALDYLSFKRIVHRDVRAANCLIDDRRTLKLADFGMAREIVSSKKLENLNSIVHYNNRESYVTTVSEPLDYSYFCKRRRDKFPVTWMAPESIARGEFSSASDVWSLGVMMFEIVMLGDRPFGSWSPQRVYEYLKIGGIPQLPLDISYSSREVIEMCWWKEPRRRATAAAVKAHLTANPTAISHAVVARDTTRRSTREASAPSTCDSGYSEMRPLSNDPRISTN